MNNIAACAFEGDARFTVAFSRFEHRTSMAR
jgi:hypothetical protein